MVSKGTERPGRKGGNIAIAQYIGIGTYKPAAWEAGDVSFWIWMNGSRMMRKQSNGR